MLNLKNIADDLSELQDRYWPPVEPFNRFGERFMAFLESDAKAQNGQLVALRASPEAHGEFLQLALGTIYAYIFGYKDSPLFLSTDDRLEVRMQVAKIVLEREMLEHFLKPRPVPALSSAEAGIDYLERLALENEGVLHPFFDFLADQASERALRTFLRLEVIRNEVVDDEVAFLIVGLQGTMKKVMTSNLWDECGNGRLQGFHTYWLRRLVERGEDWQELKRWRVASAPWFSKITSNSFNMMLTRSGYAYRAYGSFLMTEGWVKPHFDRILKGMARVGLDDPDTSVYFSRHAQIDPHHTAEMIAALRVQRPVLEKAEVDEIILGAHTAISAGTKMYERLHPYLAANA
ncbi:iron-containing redox enzyme family protein [Archangium sp.]|uniref:iron-containing redox enzyme family protein n=1 Tax=Archangium sp. TaxID=1872627 RepID=UPI002D6870BD|nr:iron-containing redox enzyme family protein [Archangium sp.]HYO54133.1 iron-containing redox enzyme family protein [Archangium sp.]